MDTLNIIFFVLDDDKDLLQLMEELIKKNGITNYKLFTHHEEFMQAITDDIHVCVIDHFLTGGLTGIHICHEIKRRNKDSFVIVMTGQRSFDVAIEYLNTCANRYIDKGKDNYLQLFEEYMNVGLKVAKERIIELQYINERMKKIESRTKQYE